MNIGRIMLLLISCFAFLDLGESQLTEWMFGKEKEDVKEPKPWEKKRSSNIDNKIYKQKHRDPDVYKTKKIEL